MHTPLALDYLDVGIIAADHRSTDGTGAILSLADPSLRVVHVHESPPRSGPS